jgi:hypothetical protein
LLAVNFGLRLPLGLIALVSLRGSFNASAGGSVSLMVLKLLMAACVLVVVAPQWAQSNGAAGLPFARRDDMPDKPRQLRTGRTADRVANAGASGSFR